MDARISLLRPGRVAAIAALAVAAMMLGPNASLATTSVRPARSSRRTYDPAVSSRMTLARSPEGLQTAARAMLGRPSGFTTSSRQKAELTASDGAEHDYFGASVAISGSTAVVGAVDKSTSTGAAYVFVRSGTTWSQQAELTASDGAHYDEFGFSVGISGSTAVVGAVGKGAFTQGGAAYVFKRSVTTWSQQAELTASDGAPHDNFGASAAVSGSTVVVGADTKNSSTGAAYVFARSGTTWPQQAKLTGSNSVSNDRFGSSVSISVSTTVVGAPGRKSNHGAAYVFVRSGTTWSQLATLTASDSHAYAFGRSAAVSGSTTVVGAWETNSFSGTAYVFVASGTTWSQQATLTASDGAINDSFGLAVAVSGSKAVVGAFGHSSYTGAAYIFAVPTQ